MIQWIEHWALYIPAWTCVEVGARTDIGWLFSLGCWFYNRLHDRQPWHWNTYSSELLNALADCEDWPEDERGGEV